VLTELEDRWTGAGVRIDHLDGLTVEADDWWFNVRASNTEPLLRLNAEGKDEATMARVRDSALATIRSQP
jgi:phosphomannomutase